MRETRNQAGALAQGDGRMAEESGPDLVRQALAAATGSEERRLVRQAAGEAALELVAELERRFETESVAPPRLGPFLDAWRRIIWELEALAAGVRLTPLHLHALAPGAEDPSEAEFVEAARCSAELVGATLPQQRISSVHRRRPASPGEYSIVEGRSLVDFCGRAAPTSARRPR